MQFVFHVKFDQIFQLRMILLGKYERHVLQSTVWSVLLYGGEPWTLLAKDLGALSVFYMRCLRCI